MLPQNVLNTCIPKYEDLVKFGNHEQYVNLLHEKVVTEIIINPLYLLKNKILSQNQQ